MASDQQMSGLQLHVEIDRTQASRLNVPIEAIDDTLYDAFGQRQISIIFTQLNQYRVVLEVPPEFRNSVSDLDKIYVKSTTGSLGSAERVCDGAHSDAPLVVTHQGQFPSLTCRSILDGLLARAGRSCHRAGPSGHWHAGHDCRRVRWQRRGVPGITDERPFLILAAIVVIYIVLGVLYESYIHPLTILSTLPSAGVGALSGAALGRMDFSLVALIGVVLLIGIVKKNAIMMIDFALERSASAAFRPAPRFTRPVCFAFAQS